MDSIDALPTANVPMSPDEQRVLNQYFEPSETQTSNKKSTEASYREIAYITGLFALLSNPLTDTILSKLHPLCENPILLVVVKSLLFLVGYWAINRYLLVEK